MLNEDKMHDILIDVNNAMGKVIKYIEFEFEEESCAQLENIAGLLTAIVIIYDHRVPLEDRKEIGYKTLELIDLIKKGLENSSTDLHKGFINDNWVFSYAGDFSSLLFNNKLLLRRRRN